MRIILEAQQLDIFASRSQGVIVLFALVQSNSLVLQTEMYLQRHAHIVNVGDGRPVERVLVDAGSHDALGVVWDAYLLKVPIWNVRDRRLSQVDDRIPQGCCAEVIRELAQYWLVRQCLQDEYQYTGELTMAYEEASMRSTGQKLPPSLGDALLDEITD